MTRAAIPTWSFAVVVVCRGDRFLLVLERKHGQLWYLPAGGVQPGETFAMAALRETLEETGVPIRLTGLLRLEHTPMSPVGDPSFRLPCWSGRAPRSAIDNDVRLIELHRSFEMKALRSDPQFAAIERSRE